MSKSKLDEQKLAGLHDIGSMLDKKYGEPGSASREDFHIKSIAWYYGEILRERRKELKITQQELADKVGIKRTYISQVEQGRTDMQLSTFLTLSRALGLTLNIETN